MKQGQETNHIWTQEAGTHDTHNRTLTLAVFSDFSQYLAKIQLFEKLPLKAFKVVQMKFLAMHITNQKLSFDIFTVGNLQNIFMEHDLYLIS